MPFLFFWYCWEGSFSHHSLSCNEICIIAWTTPLMLAISVLLAPPAEGPPGGGSVGLPRKEHERVCPSRNRLTGW
eukprot:121053-Amphidinium_carterae.1